MRHRTVVEIYRIYKSGQNRISDDDFNSHILVVSTTLVFLSPPFCSEHILFASVFVDSLEIYKANEWKETFQSL